RLLSTSPSLLLLDEPFSNLDFIHKNQLKTVIRDISEELGITCILISHDPQDTLSWADKILVMQAGQVVQQGTPQEIYLRPTNEYVAGLFGKYTVLTEVDFHQFLGSNSTSETKFVRPEQFSLSPTGPGRTGVVQTLQYFGSFTE